MFIHLLGDSITCDKTPILKQRYKMGISMGKKNASDKGASGIRASKGSPSVEGWREILLKVADMDLWQDERKRERRPRWKQYLTQAEQAVRRPRKPLSQVLSINNQLYT